MKNKSLAYIRENLYWTLAILLMIVAVLFWIFILIPISRAGVDVADPLGGENSYIASTSNSTIPNNVRAKRIKPDRRTVQGVYLTAYSAGNPAKIDKIIAAIKNSQVNAVVIDIKDYTGYLSYDSKLKMVGDLGLKEIKIKDLAGVIKKLKDNNIYTIARIAVFQDPILSSKKPEWAVLNKNTNSIWRDRKGLSWLDPANPEVWQYHVDIAKEAVGLGFDEINLDYIRFPSDGQISAMVFPKWKNGGKKSDVMRSFFAYFYEGMKDERAYLSADLFGMTTTVKNDMNIGQLLEDAAPYFDYICPMVYPSHYPTGYLGYKNPADYPYQVIFRDIKSANDRLAVGLPSATSSEIISSTTPVFRAKIRPWIQDFNMGAIYNASMIKLEIKASKDAGGDGWLAWDPKNLYTWEAYK